MGFTYYLVNLGCISLTFLILVGLYHWWEQWQNRRRRLRTVRTRVWFHPHRLQDRWHVIPMPLDHYFDGRYHVLVDEKNFCHGDGKTMEEAMKSYYDFLEDEIDFYTNVLLPTSVESQEFWRWLGEYVRPLEKDEKCSG